MSFLLLKLLIRSLLFPCIFLEEAFIFLFTITFFGRLLCWGVIVQGVSKVRALFRTEEKILLSKLAGL